MELINFIPFSECFDPECDSELLIELTQILKVPLEEIYVVGDDNEDPPETEGVSWYLGDYFNSNYDIGHSSDKYITITERAGITVAWTSDHGYNNWYVAKNDIAKIPSIDDYAGPLRDFLNS